MSPFVDDEDDRVVDQDWSPIPPDDDQKPFFLKDDKKFLIIGGASSVAALFTVAYIIYSGSRPVDLDELPIIQADPTPVKVKPQINEEVKHQDKTVYDNISGDKRVVEEKLAPQPEEVLSIPEMDSGEIISEEEKKSILQAFDELAPEKEYKINYNAKAQTAKAIINDSKSAENELHPPINKIDEEKIAQDAKKEKKTRNKGALEKSAAEDGGLMVQIATVSTKTAAEAEYNRILRKNKFLKKNGKRIFKIDMGERNGVKYGIQVGPFKNREEARKIVTAMKKNGFFSHISK
ncbi:MAG: SPOR domain-containing protein [Holosporaceae bacterium]|jgi:cell division septation protein DedD|nr:SPOR domain-containing protein [Holosporaceae bacterium]